MECALSRPYPRVRLEGGCSYGGSQGWFPDKGFRACGCGVVACADTLLYLEGVEELGLEDYFSYAAALRRYFPLIPGRGIDGLRLALGLNLCLRMRGIPLGGRWAASGGRFWDRAAEMLGEDLPVIAAVGPNFPKLWGKERLTLYQKGAAGFTPAERTKGHFLTVTGLDGRWLRVSSWGRELYIAREDYSRYQRKNGALLTNLLYLRKKRPLLFST